MSVDRWQALSKRIQDGPILTRWHWLGWNFSTGPEGFNHFSSLTIAALDAVDQLMPGYAEEMIKRLEGMGGREGNMRDYESIVAWLAELLVVHHLVTYRWEGLCTFSMEPTAGNSPKNPEILIGLEGLGSLGVEVKSPDLTNHRSLRSRRPWQILARTELDPADLDAAVTLPVDNKIKDFLVSADAKFANFRAADPAFRSILVIVWDDFVNEPLTALLAPSCGLLTPNSFHRDPAGNAIEYPNVDAVLLMRHQHQLRLGMANRPPAGDRRHFLDYGSYDAFPPHVLVPNPAGRVLEVKWVEALRGWRPESLSHMAEYVPGELIVWVDCDDK
ncbi:hypothetical protein ABZ652_11615 [Micromonospora chalcea]|uniref:hypothetical protein n=1 Tax=Micromonospora chalcea TaxID=1874 RepID=UPI0034051D5E